MPVLLASIDETPTKDSWQEVGQVDQLYLYPVKSLAAVPVPHLSVGLHAGCWGRLVDREFMVIDSKGKMITARRYPAMIQIKAKKTDEGAFVLSHPNASEDLVIPATVLEAGAGAEMSLEIWGESCSGRDLGAEAGLWLSNIILGNANGGLRLVQHAAGVSSRPNKKEDLFLCPLGRTDRDRPYFADGYPFMLMTRPSVEHLNQKLAAEKLPMVIEESRFRPNIYVGGNFPPFAEDRWAFIKIGSAVFRNTIPCTRCVLTTVDPYKGEKDPAGQPLKLLRNYRACTDPQEKAAYGTSPCMGINLGVEQEGEIKLGDPVFVTMGLEPAKQQELN